MATKLDAEKMKLDEKYAIMRKKYLEFKSKNVTFERPMVYSVYTEEPVELYMVVSDYIHQAIVVLEISGVQIKNGKDRSFISAIKLIDNLVKHDKQALNIDELMSSTPRLAGSGTNKDGIFTFKPDVSLESFWKEIPSHIVIKPENQNQKGNYDLKLKDQLVIDTMRELNSIVNKYI